MAHKQTRHFGPGSLNRVHLKVFYSNCKQMASIHYVPILVIMIMCTYEGLFSHAALLRYVVSLVCKADILRVTETGETMRPGDHTKIPPVSFSLQVARVPPLI